MKGSSIMTDSGKDVYMSARESPNLLVGSEMEVSVVGEEKVCNDVGSGYYEFDDEHVYANMQELQEESMRNETPPTPDVTDKPTRILGNGWLEYMTESGRAYFFNRERGECSWKPPRFQMFKPLVSDDADDFPAKYTNEVYGSTESVVFRDVKEKAAEQLSTSYTQYTDENYFGRSDEYGHSRYGSVREEGTSIDYVNMPSSSTPNVSQRSVKSGTLDKVSGILRSGTLNLCKIADAGTQLRKKEWTSCYVFLSSAHLIFYKDAKSAEKLGKHYEAPLGMCDLRGANLQWYEDKRRKHVLQLKLVDGTIYLFNTLNCQDINSWFHAMKRVIRRQPQPDSHTTPVLERAGTGSPVVRTGSLTQSVSTAPFGPSQLRSSSKKSKPTSKDSNYSSPYDELALDTSPNKAKVMHKLKRFFRSRPTIESLKEKGIYRTEPVFGNSLVSICQQEKSLVPRFIYIITEVIELKGIEADGIYRVSGNLSAIQRIRCAVDQDRYAEVLNEDDVHVLTGALKLFFRELSEPIFPFVIAKELIAANRLPKGDQKLQVFDELLKKLPLVHKETLKVLLSHLIRVAECASKNRMEVHNLAIVFGPSLFGIGNEIAQMGTDPRKSSLGKKMDKRPIKYGSKEYSKASGVQNNSHFVFNMIMQGQIVEFLLTEFHRFSAFQENRIGETSV